MHDAVLNCDVIGILNAMQEEFPNTDFSTAAAHGVYKLFVSLSNENQIYFQPTSFSGT